MIYTVARQIRTSVFRIQFQIFFFFLIILINVYFSANASFIVHLFHST